MKTLHGGLTISSKIISGKKDVVETLLNAINEQQNQVVNNLFPFPKLKLTHFITWVVLPKQETPSGKQLPERILLFTSYSGRKKDHINELVAVGLPALHKVYQN